MPVRLAFAFLLVTLLSGCVSEQTKHHIDVQIKAHDGYERLIDGALAGTLKGKLAALNVPSQDVLKTPPSVLRMLNLCLEGLHKDKLSFYTLKFTLGDGPDPATLALGEPKHVPPKTGVTGTGSSADDVLPVGDGE